MTAHEIPSTRFYNSMITIFLEKLRQTDLTKKEKILVEDEVRALDINDKKLISFLKTKIKDYKLSFSYKDIYQEATQIIKKKDDKDVVPAELLCILKDLELFRNITLIEFDKTIVGEEETRQTIFLVAMGGSLVENAEPTSANLMVNDLSGAGKDFVVKNVLKIIPKEKALRKHRISEKVFTYWHNAYKEPDWTWYGKILYLEDITNSVLNSDVFKVMASSDGENESTVLINQLPVDILVRGKPALILTIASANPTIENLRRFPICNLDTTEEQTKKILEVKAKYHEKGIRPSYDKDIIKGLNYLKRVKVKVPFATNLTKILSTKNIIIRTHYDRFIDYIKFSVAIYQFKREIDEEGFLIANYQDYNIARIAMIKTTSNIFSIPLTKNQQRILDIFRNKHKEEFCSVSDLEPEVTFISDKMLRTELDRLTNYGFLLKEKEDRESSKRPVMVYKFLEQFKICIPEWEDIQNITSVSSVTTVTTDSNVSNDGTNETLETNEYQTQGKEFTKLPGTSIDVGKCGYCGKVSTLTYKDKDGNFACSGCAGEK